MPQFQVFVTRTVKFAIEVEADSVDQADSLSLAVPDEDRDLIDSDDVFDYILDEDGNEYQWSNALGVWVKEQRKWRSKKPTNG